jgi:hypothetical protein
MAQETLRIIVDAGQLDQIINKVKTANTQSNTLSRQINDARKGAREAGINLDDLPTLNRDARLLANSLNIPLFREASALLFQGRRGVRALQMAREAEAVSGFDPALASQLNIQSLLGQAALVAFVTKIAIDTAVAFTKEQNRKNVELEDMIRGNLELTFDEFQSLDTDRTGFATLLSQMREEVGDVGLLETIKKTVIETVLGIIGVTPPIPQEFIDNWSVLVE